MYLVGEGIISQSDLLIQVNNCCNTFDTITTNKKVEYYNIPAAFDIEVTSWYEGEQKGENKRAMMYCWQFGIGNLVTIGRTWDEFKKFFLTLVDYTRIRRKPTISRVCS